MTPDTPTQAAARLLELAKAAQKYTDEIGEGWFSADESHSLINKIDGALIAACDPETITTLCTALQEACAERDALREKLATASVFDIGDATVERAKQRDGSYLWAARSESGLCLNKSGEWEYEPMPSSRDDDFLFRCRFATAEEAAAAINTARKEGANVMETRKVIAAKKERAEWDGLARKEGA